MKSAKKKADSPTVGCTDLKAYLKPSEYIDFNHPAVAKKAADLANGIPSGLCYQRLVLDINISNSRFCLHGLNAVYLNKYGWYSIDAGGNKPGVDVGFCPPVPKAFKILYAG